MESLAPPPPESHCDLPSSTSLLLGTATSTILHLLSVPNTSLSYLPTLQPTSLQPLQLLQASYPSPLLPPPALPVLLSIFQQLFVLFPFFSEEVFEVISLLFDLLLICEQDSFFIDDGCDCSTRILGGRDGRRHCRRRKINS